jgi:hypothetical protein
MKSKAKKKEIKKGKPEKQNDVVDYCPKCNRPFYYYPMQYSVPRQNDSKSWNRIIFGSIIAVIFIIIILFFAAIFSTIRNFEPEYDTQKYNYDVIISDGGHFKYSLDWIYFDETEIALDITEKNNKHFDIYIMDTDQYENSYGNQNMSFMAFSSLYSKENITGMNETIKLQAWHDEYHLIIDNMDTPLIIDDAIPNGTINLKVKISTKTEFGSYYIDFINDNFVLPPS